MIKRIIIKSIFVILMFIVLPISAKADFGDLRYEITDVGINDSKITFEGWAFIHRTNNYVSINENNDGGHKIMMQAIAGGKVIDTKVVFGFNYPNYNFYCELFDKVNNLKCNEENYKNIKKINTCKNESNGTGSYASQCYYEDISFKITFDVKQWSSGGYEDISFKIAASNNDFENKLSNKKDAYEYDGYKYNGDYYTEPESVYISRFSVNNLSSNYIEMDKSSLTNKIEFIAKYGCLNKLEGSDKYCVGYGENNKSKGNVYLLELAEVGNFIDGRSKDASNALCPKFLGNDCKSAYTYAIKVKDGKYPVYNSEGKKNPIVIKPFAGGENDKYTILEAYGSHIKVTGDNSFKVNVKNDSKCKPKSPSSGELNCNGSKIFNSDCESLGISTDKGSANVKIEQTGTVTSVLTPDNIYAGGGFNFGIMYYNTIKWSYVSDSERSRVMGINGLHSAVTQEMNKRIKDYDTYISGLNVNSISLGGKIISDGFLYKSCNTSNSNKDYYNKELTVSCIFHIPGSTIKQDGSVNYVYNSLGNGINNKYYTPMNYSGKYDIKASIEGMDRITSTYSKNDSAEQGKSWTGKWEDNFTNCSINIYSLIKSANTIYRPIDIKNPFPNSRNAGINWYDWIAVDANREKLVNSYNKLDYYAILNNQEIADIKMYNKEHNYLNWDSIDDYTGNSSFITEKDYINRVGDN